ncbi:P17/29C-like protein DDB_G0287399 [Galendromus occidentalis]|uniref:P17/29C-like protein DDB_G0287399 n=1 Tax=Galendromus occidentalis TaxID=34638 RepID=A0AAJ7L527_9ACAR|nr:P17/29C-like protein DDB_G0287399 [Galendromus occidentalis]
MRAFSCFVAVCVATLGANAESTLKSSASTPAATSEVPNLQEDEAAFRQAVGSSLSSLGFSTGGGSAAAQGFQSGASSGSYQPPYNALNSVYGITYHGDYNQLANYLQPGSAGGPLKPNQKTTISSRFRNFMNSLFFRRTNKHPPAFHQPPSGSFGGSGYPSSASFPGFGSSGVVPSSFGAFPSSGQAQYDFSTLVGASGTGGSKGSYGPFSSGSGLGGLSSVSTATAFGPSVGGGSAYGSSGTGSSFGSSGTGSSFGSSGAGSPYGSSAGSFTGSSAYSGSSPSFSASQAGSAFNRFSGSSASGSTGSGGTTYFPGENSQHHSSIGSSSVYQNPAFGKGIDDSKSDEDKDGKDDQE